MAIRPLTSAEFPQAIALWQYCFRDDDAFSQWYFHHRANAVLAALDEDDSTIIAQLLTVPGDVLLRGQQRSGQLVSGVATAPAFRSRGHMTDLMRETLAYLHAQNSAVSTLFPFDYGFYQKYGWAQCADSLDIRAKLSQLPSARPEGAFQVFDDITGHEADFSAIYHACFANHSGLLVRSGSGFTNWVTAKATAHDHAALYSYNGSPEGYLLYRFAGRTLEVYEMGTLTPRARRDCLSFLAGHASLLEDLVLTTPADDPTWRLLHEKARTVTLKPQGMLRLVSITQALTGLPTTGNASVVLQIQDQFAPWNQGNWQFSAANGALQVTPTAAPAAATLSIDALTQWAVGYASAQALAHRGLNLPPAAIAAMDELLAQQPTFLFEKY